MKNMKKSLMSFLMFGLVLVPTLGMNAMTEIPNFSSLIINGESVNLAKCEEDLDTKSRTCNVIVSQDTTQVTITAEHTGFTIDTNSSTDITNPVMLNENDTPTVVHIELIDDNDSTNIGTYTINLIKGEIPAPTLNSLKVKVGNDEKVLDLTKEDKTYEVSVPYNIHEVTILTDADSGIDVSGDGVQSVSDGSVLIVRLSKNDKTTEYKINIKQEENPLKQTLKDALKAKYGETVVLDELYDDSAEFIYYKELSDGTVLAKGYSVAIDENSDVDKVMEDLEKALTGASDGIVVVPSDGKLTDEALEAIRNDKTFAYIPGNDKNNAVWFIDGSKVTDKDKGFDLTITLGEDVKKEIREKIEKLLDPKDNGLIIDFAHSGNLPKGTTVVIATGDRFDNNTDLTLYYYNPKTGKLEVAVKNLKANYGEVSFELEHASSYVLLPTKNNAQTGVLNVVFYALLSVVSLAGIVVLLKKKAN